MKSVYKVEFSLVDGSKEVVIFEVEDLAKAILEWGRNRSVESHKVLESSIVGGKKLLLG